MLEIWQRTQELSHEALDKASAQAADIAAVGVTNQRETTLVWNRRTGKPYANAIVGKIRATGALQRNRPRDRH